MSNMVQVHYTVPYEEKKFMDNYTQQHHTTNSKFLRKIFKEGILKAKAEVLSKKFDKELASQPINKNIQNNKDFNKWLLK